MLIKLKEAEIDSSWNFSWIKESRRRQYFVYVEESLTQSQGKFGGVAQLGEHLPCKQGVRSSILLISTTAFFAEAKNRDNVCEIAKRWLAKQALAERDGAYIPAVVGIPDT